jgi:hypothetical protein
MDMQSPHAKHDALNTLGIRPRRMSAVTAPAHRTASGTRTVIAFKALDQKPFVNLEKIFEKKSFTALPPAAQAGCIPTRRYL